MKHILKQAEPAAFREWKDLANDDWKPTFFDLSGSVKQSLKAALIAEQGFICCYCERRLIDADSHIEHFEPQHRPEVDPLEYGNLLCSCQNQLKKGEPRHCGNRKGDWFDPELLVSPLDLDCEARFSFSGDGRMKPADAGDQAAVTTIEKLGLAIPKLNALRAYVIDPFLDDTLTREELDAFVIGYLQPDEDGRLGEFWTTIRDLFGKDLLGVKS
jgi:uncharacterized protein (TIGR02646 family)